MSRFGMALLWCGVVACGGSMKPSDEPAVDAPMSTGDAPSSTDAALGPDPAGDGPNAVVESTLQIPGAQAGRTLPATLYVPDGATPRPLVIVSPGFQMARTQYASYAHHLATWGFVVVLADYAESGFFIDHARIAADVPAVIDWAIDRTELAIDPAHIATAGHSLGGKIAVFAATLDSRIGAVVAWDPVDSQNPSVAPEKMANLAAAVAVVGETTNASGGGMPCAPAADNFQTFYAAAHAPAIAVTVEAADHMDWVDDPSCGFCGFCTAGAAPADRARTVTRRLDVAWLRARLLGDTAMEIWLDAPPELAAGEIALARK